MEVVFDCQSLDSTIHICVCLLLFTSRHQISMGHSIVFNIDNITSYCLKLLWALPQFLMKGLM